MDNQHGKIPLIPEVIRNKNKTQSAQKMLWNQSEVIQEKSGSNNIQKDIIVHIAKKQNKAIK